MTKPNQKRRNPGAYAVMHRLDYLILMATLAPGTVETWGQLCCMAEQIRVER